MLVRKMQEILHVVFHLISLIMFLTHLIQCKPHTSFIINKLIYVTFN